jgi:hypothetical protein
MDFLFIMCCENILYPHAKTRHYKFNPECLPKTYMYVRMHACMYVCLHECLVHSFVVLGDGGKLMGGTYFIGGLPLKVLLFLSLSFSHMVKR